MGLFKNKKVEVPARRRLVENSSSASSERQNISRNDSFRRGRTIVGTVTSIYSNNDPMSLKDQVSLNVSSHRTHIHHLSIKRRKLSGLLILSLLITSVLWLVVSNFTASINLASSRLDIIKPIDDVVYKKSINNFLDANPLSRLSFLFDKKSFDEYMTATHSDILSITRHGNSLKPGETDFVVTFRSPVAGWKMKDTQYYVDSNGVSFEKNYYNEPKVQIVDNSGIPSQSGVAIASKRFLGFVGRVVSLSDNSGYEVTQAVLPKNTTRELDIYLKGNETFIKLNIDRGVGEQIEDMSRALKYFTSRSEKPKYIDVRVSGKAFYKI